METVFGLIIGIILGLSLLFLFSKLTKSVTSGSFGTKSALGGAALMLLPFALLTAAAFIWLDALVWIGIGTAASMALGAVILFVIKRKEDTK